MVNPQPDVPHAVGVDVGGTKILSGLINAEGTVLATARRATPKDGPTLVTEIEAAVREVSAGHDTALPVGCGFPGLVTRDGLTRYGPNIALREYPLRDALRERLATPIVVVENDANAAAWAEFVVGAGRSVRDTMVMFTLGTGVGGGLIVGGRLHRGAHGFAGELGHVVLEVGGQPGPSGVDGELEAYSSGSAVVRMGREAHAAGRWVGTPLEGPLAPDGEAITRAARDCVAPAVAIMDSVGRYLGIGAAAFINALDPEMIVVGGGAAAAGELVLGPARKALTAHVLGSAHRPEVPMVSAELGPEAGMIGAGLLALLTAAGA
ncbi:MAG TPA: ROK family protein [Euzebya sp.]|nr:ROK family protein [Euzebya sp.]